MILRRCGDGEREEGNTQREGEDMHKGRGSHLARYSWARVKVAEQLYTPHRQSNSS